MTLIAGHSFDLSGRCILVLADGTVCSRRWIDIMHTDDTCVGASAHRARRRPELRRGRTDRHRETTPRLSASGRHTLRRLGRIRATADRGDRTMTLPSPPPTRENSSGHGGAEALQRGR